MRITSLEGQTAIFLALTEFHRTVGNDNAKSINKLLKENGVGHNHIPFVKAEMLSRHIVNREFTEWKTERAVPSMVMAESLAEAASKRLTAYQKDRKQKREQAQAPEVKVEDTPVLPSLEEAIAQLKAVASKNNLKVEILFK